MASRLERLQSDIHYCYQCLDWFVGENWELHCQSHLAGMTTKRCGTMTYCHTLVRPGYCPFCMSDTGLPASKRLESWTRDHKLWSHVRQDLERRQWPRTCPHPLCDSLIKDALALQFHFVDEHGLSRTCPERPAETMALDSTVEKAQRSGDNKKNMCSSLKRKSPYCYEALEWMSPQSP